MDIRINYLDAKYLWNTLNLKAHPRADNDDEQWDDDNNYYLIYDYDNVVIKAVFTVLDSTAEMDSSEFCDWDNPDALYVDTGCTII